jgi:glycolate oxidase subunit GlcD
LALNQAKLEDELKKIVGEQNVLSDEVDLSVYECDAETFDIARPDLVVLPGSSEEVAAVVKVANQFRVPFTPRGAGTGLSGGATTVRGGISLVLSRMTKILAIDAEDGLAIVETGVTNSSVSRAVAKYGLHYAPDPSSQMASTIGGNIAENAGGPHTLKYGLTTDHILGLKVVLPNGEVTTFGGNTNSGLGIDWLGLFVGSEGTLGLATEATLRLTAIPPAVKTMLAYFPTLESGGEAVSKIIAAGVIPSAMEMIDQLTLNAVEDAVNLGLDRKAGALLIVELDGWDMKISLEMKTVETIARSYDASAVTWAKDAGERANIWKARKLAFGALGRIAPNGYVLDGVIPRSRLSQAISKIREIGDQYGLKIANV